MPHWAGPPLPHLRTVRIAALYERTILCVFTTASCYGDRMDERRLTLVTFRERLLEVVRESGLSRTEFAESAGIDRSTLSQLLSASNRRLPRIETLVQIATSRQASVDWLLGLSDARPMSAEMVHEQTSFAPEVRSPNDERLIAWYEQARGYKIRYVPSTVPDMLKTEAVIRHELGHAASTSPAQMIDTAAARLDWTRAPGSDLECCNSVQAVEALAYGEGIYRTLSREHRVAQLEHMIELTEEFYPTLRWFLFDGLERSAAPVTIFGPQRAALYLGQMYLVLSSAEQVRTLTRHFDGLIRAATVQPHELPSYLNWLLTTLRA